MHGKKGSTEMVRFVNPTKQTQTHFNNKSTLFLQPVFLSLERSQKLFV